MSAMRVFMGFQEVAGYYTNLKKGFNELGIESVFVNLDKNPFSYGAGQDEPALIRLVRYTAQRRFATAKRYILPKLWWFTIHQLSYALLFAWAVAKFDVFIFGFLTTFYHYRELPLLRALGKRIVYVFHGSDSRPHYLNGFGSETFPVDKLVAETRKQKADVRRAERYAHLVVCNPLSAHFHEKPYLAYQMVGIPFTPRAMPPKQLEQPAPHRVRILHAPSQKTGKGTAQIRAMIESLQRKGHLIDYVEVSGKPHTGVLDELVACDFVVDQLYSDTPMAHFAREAAAYGKPAVVGGYGGQESLRCFAADELPPTLYCRPEEMEAAIERLILDAAYRKELGARAKQFVDTKWTPRAVAERFARAVQGQIDVSWEFYPDETRYLFGCGLSAPQAKSLVRSVIEFGGISALQLRDKQDLEARFVEYAGCNGSPE